MKMTRDAQSRCIAVHMTSLAIAHMHNVYTCMYKHCDKELEAF